MSLYAKFATTVPQEVETGVTAIGEARRSAGKTNSCDEALGKPNSYPAQTEFEAKEDVGSARRCIDTQVGTPPDSNPKKR